MPQEQVTVSGISNHPQVCDNGGPSLTEPVRNAVSEAAIGLRHPYEPPLRDLRLYGTAARNDATDGSDRDLLVILDEPVSPGTEIERTGPHAPLPKRSAHATECAVGSGGSGGSVGSVGSVGSDDSIILISRPTLSSPRSPWHRICLPRWCTWRRRCRDVLRAGVSSFQTYGVRMMLSRSGAIFRKSDTFHVRISPALERRALSSRRAS